MSESRPLYGKCWPWHYWGLLFICTLVLWALILSRDSRKSPGMQIFGILEPLFPVAYIAAVAWVGEDAVRIGVRRGKVKGLMDMGPLEWQLACLLLWFPFFPLYLVKRAEFKRINKMDTPPSSS